ncbi:MAG TPA: tyrosine-type recombinase/integrase [Dehalococcoidia bacterium]|nr:tyrosine-type recombinase/integrase [Dehalococcoidia bacterium]
MAKKQSWTDMDKSRTPFPELRRAYRFYNETSGKSPLTVKWYDERLELFERFLGDDATLAEVTVQNVRAYIAELQCRTERHTHNRFVKNKEGTLSSSYINGFARSLRAFSSWLYEDGYTDTNVLKVLKPPKVTQKVIEVLTDAQIGKLLGSFDRNEPYGARNHAIVITLLDCGLRASEICELTLANARFDEGFLKVRGKGDKERLVPVGQAAQASLATWRDRFRRQFVAEEDAPWLFLSASGQRLAVDTLEQMVKKAGEKADITGLHPHRFRHTFATRFLTENLGDTFQLQQLLGHTSLEMVRRYVSLASMEKVIIERRASSIDRLLSTPRPQARRVQPRRLRPIRLVH